MQLILPQGKVIKDAYPGMIPKVFTYQLNSMPMIQVSVNDAIVQFEAETSLHNVLDNMSIAQKTGIAVAVNYAVIPKSEWNQTILKNNDNVMVIQATQGG